MILLTYGWKSYSVLVRSHWTWKAEKLLCSNPGLTGNCHKWIKLSNRNVDLGKIFHKPHLLLTYKPNLPGIYVISSREIKIHFLPRAVLVKVKQQQHFKGKNVIAGIIPWLSPREQLSTTQLLIDSPPCPLVWMRTRREKKNKKAKVMH